jgi:hypothetical protein
MSEVTRLYSNNTNPERRPSRGDAVEPPRTPVDSKLSQILTHLSPERREEFVRRLPDGRPLATTPPDGLVSTTMLAAWTQALVHRMNQQTVQAFQTTWNNVCRSMKTTRQLAKTMVLMAPVEAARHLLKDDYLMARAGSNFLEIWKCLPVMIQIKQEN